MTENSDTGNEIPCLRIDIEFRNLITPLSENELAFLENNLLEDGCRDPIVIWGNTIIDGHNRYQICSRHGLPFKTLQMDFESRDDAISWICAAQLGRRNVSEETRRYLIGKRYEAEKHIRRRKERDSVPHMPLANEDKQAAGSNLKRYKNPTAERIAEDYHISHATVEKYGVYSRAVDKVGSKAQQMVPVILSGKYRISHNNMIRLAHMDSAAVKQLEKRLGEVADNNAFVSFSSSREEISKSLRKEKMPALHTEIKNMPSFDPDADINRLALTVPTWTNSLKRMYDCFDPNLISSQARNKLVQTLETLIDIASRMLCTIRE